MMWKPADSPPENDDFVLVYRFNGTCEFCSYEDGEWINIFSCICAEPPDYWMPLPSPPVNYRSGY